MKNKVAPQADLSDTPTRVQSEFEVYMAENRDNVGRKTALWDLYAKEYESEGRAIVEASEVVRTLFAELSVPGWADEDETRNSEVPALSKWVSVPVRVFLRREFGRTNLNNSMALARVEACIHQVVTAAEPHIEITHRANPNRAEHLETLDTVRMTLSEAAELAHGLLLLLDVAHGSDQSAAGGA